MRVYTLLACFLACACASPPAAILDTYVPDTSMNSEYSTGQADLRAIRYSDLLSLRDIGDPYGSKAIFVSPDGSQIAFQIREANVETNSYTLSWYILDSKLVHVSDGGDAILSGELRGPPSGAIEVGEAKWSPDGQWIAYRKKTDDEIQIWRARADGSGEEQLTRNDADVIAFNWSSDGTEIHFKTMPQTRAQLREASTREAAVGYFFDDRFVALEEFRPIRRQTLADRLQGKDAPVAYFVYDLLERREIPSDAGTADLIDNAKAKLALTIRQDDSRDLRHVVERDGKFAWAENKHPDEYQGYNPPLTVSRFEPNVGEVGCAAPECTGMITDVWLSASSDAVYFRRLEGVNFASVAMYAWTGENSVTSVLKNDDWFGGCEAALSGLVCLYEGSTQPRAIVRVDLDGGELKTLFDPNPEFRNFRFGNVRKLEWKGVDGAEAIGHLVYPVDFSEGQRYPLAIVQYRSQGFLRGGVGDEYPIHVLSANGFAVLSFDRPESWDVEAREPDVWRREQANWGDDLWERSSALKALEYFIDQLDAEGIIDPSRIGITGLSDGAETVWYAMINSDRFAAAVASSGGWSPIFYYLVPEDVRSGYYNKAAELFAPGIGNDDRWRRISPEFHAKNINTPILIQTPDRELLSAVPSHEALKDAGKPVEMHVFPKEYHIKTQPVHRSAVYERSVDWFNFWLRDTEDPDIQKLEQYRRWRILRDTHDANIADNAKR